MCHERAYNSPAVTQIIPLPGMPFFPMSTEILPILKDLELAYHPLKFSLLTPFNIFPFSLFYVPFKKNLNKQLYPLSFLRV